MNRGASIGSGTTDSHRDYLRLIERRFYFAVTIWQRGISLADEYSDGNIIRIADRSDRW